MLVLVESKDRPLFGSEVPLAGAQRAELWERFLDENSRYMLKLAAGDLTR
jgi:hypothetical protein